jgi:hypothetical protein
MAFNFGMILVHLFCHSQTKYPNHFQSICTPCVFLSTIAVFSVTSRIISQKLVTSIPYFFNSVCT